MLWVIYTKQIRELEQYVFKRNTVKLIFFKWRHFDAIVANLEVVNLVVISILTISILCTYGILRIALKSHSSHIH